MMVLRWLTLLILAALSVLQPARAAWDSGYSFDPNGSSDRTNSRWMASVPDSTLLSDMSIPATHDSATYVLLQTDVIPLTQRMSIARQLDAGVRAFDIRCRYDNNDCPIYHGPYYLGQTMHDVLRVFKGFLQANPTETVLLMINNPEAVGGGPSEAGGVNPTPSNNAPGVSFTSLFKSNYWNNPEFAAWFWKNDNSLPTTSPNWASNIPNVPTLGSVRGKIVVLQNFGNGSTTAWEGWYGLPGNRWTGLTSRVSVQNDFQLTTNWDLYDKWVKVKNQLVAAHLQPRGNNQLLFQNWLSGAVGSFPYFVASGKSSPGTSDPLLSTGSLSMNGNGPYPDFPRTSCVGSLCTISFWGTNILSYNYITDHLDDAYKPRVGIVAADFPDLWLIEKIFQLNYRSARPVTFRAAIGGCMDVMWGNVTPGGNIWLWNCTFSSAQRFIYATDQTIRPAINPNLCIEPANGSMANGTNIQLGSCTGSVSQRFQYTPPDGSWIVSLQDPTMCIDISGASNAPGTNLQLWKCNTSSAVQKFSTATGPTFFTSELRDAGGHGMCIDDRFGNTTNGNMIQLWTCNGGVMQQFAYVPIDGTIHLHTVPGKCLIARAGGTTDGTPIDLWDCNGNAAQQFDYYPATRELRARQKQDMCVEAAGGGNSDGTAIQLWTCNGTPAQRFGRAGNLFSANLSNVDDDVYIDVNGKNVYSSHDRNPIPVLLNTWMREGDNDVSIRLGNGGCFATSLTLSMQRDGAAVDTRDFYQSVSHCGWQLEWKYRINALSGEVTRLQ